MAELIHILLVEDDEDDYVLTQDLLSTSRGRFRLEWVTTYDEALAAISQQRHDACLVDYRLGQRDGLELLREAVALGHQAPIIILTGQGDQEIDMAALKVGAADYLVKGEITPLLLERSIRYAIERKRTEEEIRHQAARAEALARVAARLNAQLDLDAVLGAVCEETARALNVPAASVTLYKEKKKAFTMAAAFGLPPEFRRRAQPVPLSLYEQSARLVGPLIVNPDVQAAPGQPDAALYAELDVRTLVVAIMQRNDRLIGTLNVNTFGQCRHFTGDELVLLQGIADQAAQAITNTDLFTQTHHLLRQTQEQAQQVQQIMDTVPDGVLLLDADRCIVLANLAALNYLPLLTGAGPGDVLTHLGDQEVAAIIEATAQGTVWYEFKLGDGKQIFEIMARPLAVDPEPGGVVLVLRDVYEERQRQEFLQTQDRLATVGQLAAGIAHDFNNIMSVITLYSQTLQKNPNLPKRDYYLSTINQQATHAAALIARILDFSRRSVMERHPADLLPFLKEVVKLLERTLPETITVELKCSDEACLARVDLTRLQQVLMNLAVNARDAMPAGGKLAVTLSRYVVTLDQRPPLPEVEPGQWLCLALADTGSGIRPETLPHIFEPFFTTKLSGQGTGLGLAQVYGIVKQHDGHIGVESRVGQGTTFTIYLPELVIAPAVTERGSENHTPLANGRETILLVEDGLITQEAIRETLETLRYKVLVAQNGQEALALFRRHQKTIDLVLSDMVMPEMGGVRLYQALQAQRPGVKLIIMTGYPLEDEGKTLLEQGIVTWIQKPFTPDEVARKVRQVLDTLPTAS